MFWADFFVDQIIKSGKYKPYHVDDMKTPSGKVHVGALRGVVIHDLLFKVLGQRGKPAQYTYCINDMDPMDGFPVYLDKKKFYKYMGSPLVNIPSPQVGFPNFANFYAQEFIDVFTQIDCRPKIIWTHQLYQEGKFDELIKLFLDKTDEIRSIFKSQYKSFKDENYFPYQPICPGCGKISTTKIHQWDGKYVYFRCLPDAVDYTQGCGFEGKVKPEKRNGKLPWKIEWPAHWKTLGVTIEWSGKDHMTKGGSWEIAAKISDKILQYPTPHAVLYEHVLTGGRKMSSSKGLGVSAKGMLDLLPPVLLRFLIVKTSYKKTLDFDPNGNTIPDLFDEHDEAAGIFYQDGIKNDKGRVWQLSQVDKFPEKQPFLPRFRDVANYLQNPAIDIKQKFQESKGSRLTKFEQSVLNQRIKYAKIWLERFAPSQMVFKIEEKPLVDLKPKQKEFLTQVVGLLEKDWEPEKLQFTLYETSKRVGIAPKEAFGTIYQALIGKNYGPKAAWFLLENKEKAIKIFKKYLS